jgi:hypothetical protein
MAKYGRIREWRGWIDKEKDMSGERGGSNL